MPNMQYATDFNREWLDKQRIEVLGNVLGVPPKANPFTLKTIHNKIIVKPFPKDEVSAGGVIIPDSAQERKAKATVMTVGGGTKDNPMTLKEGDVVYHIKDCGSPIEVDGEQYFIMRDTDVLAIESNDFIENRKKTFLQNREYAASKGTGGDEAYNEAKKQLNSY